MRRILLLFSLSILVLTSCQYNRTNNNPRAKYIFLFIGDGMGLQQVNATQIYIDSVLKENKGLSFINFPVQTFATTYAATQYITCSAAAGTALSTGVKTSIGTLGLNFNHTDSLFSIAKNLKEDGFKIGLLTSVSIDHATPAAFYAHQGSRGSSYDIAKDLLKSGYDFYASGGLVDPEGKKLKEPVPSIYALGEKASFGFTTNLNAVDTLKNKYKSVVYSAPKPGQENALKYRIDRDSTDITLADMTKKAIQTLYNPKGFFMMVEGGKIDWACHANDAATTIGEVIDFSDAISQAVDFYNSHPDETIIIVTADHETGGFSLGNKNNKYTMHLAFLKNQKLSIEQFEDIIQGKLSRSPKPKFQDLLGVAKEKLGLNDATVGLGLTDKELKQLNDSYNASLIPVKVKKKDSTTSYEVKETFSATCFDILNKKAAVGWTSTAHTGSPVPVYVLGKGSELFTGRLDNTDIPKKIRVISGVE